MVCAMQENQDLIESILNEPSILGALSPNGRHVAPKGGTYLLYDNCLFPCTLKNNVLEMHAAILPDLRGKQAVKAGKAAIKWGLARGYKVVCKTKRKAMKDGLFAAWCGMRRVGRDDTYNYYEAIRCH